MRMRLDTYFRIVLRNVRDFIPKSIGFFLVKRVQKKMPFELYDSINKDQKILNLLREVITIIVVIFLMIVIAEEYCS